VKRAPFKLVFFAWLLSMGGVAEAQPQSGGESSASGSVQGYSWDRFFLEVGYSLTLGSAHPHMRAASLPALLDPSDDPQTDGLPHNDAYIASGTRGCEAPAGEYCVRVDDAGLVFAHGIHLGFGAYLTERFALAARVRVAPMAGGGPMSHLLVGLRAHVRLTQPRRQGFHASLFVGGMAGQIQLRPAQAPTPPATTIDRPYVRTGLGGAELGFKLGHRFTENLGIFVSPEAYVMFPSVSAGAQVTVGLDFTFGTVHSAPTELEEELEEEPTEEEEEAEEPAEPEEPEEPKEPEFTPSVTPDPTPVREVTEAPAEVEGLVRDRDGRLRFRDPLRFRKNSHRLERSSLPAIDEIARILRENPQITRVQIEGHADERGPDSYNERLSQRRAESVRNALVRRGRVRAGRVTVEGFGSTRPIHPYATTEAEHEENRRVELFVILSD
jgi:outer membrane protein OmpA-like peptidoglycan-associated protein